MGFSLVCKKLIFKGIKKAFRIICIMLILEKLQLYKKSLQMKALIKIKILGNILTVLFNTIEV